MDAILTFLMNCFNVHWAKLLIGDVSSEVNPTRERAGNQVGFRSCRPFFKHRTAAIPTASPSTNFKAGAFIITFFCVSHSGPRNFRPLL